MRLNGETRKKQLCFVILNSFIKRSKNYLHSSLPAQDLILYTMQWRDCFTKVMENA